MADLSFKLALTDSDIALVSDGAGFNSIREFAGQGLEGEGHFMGLNAQTPTPMKTRYRLGSVEFCKALSPPPSIPYGAHNAQVHLVGPSGWMASFVLSEDIRADAQATLTQLRLMNKSVFLLSGDRQAAVTHVAQQIGLETACVHARMGPPDKLEFVATRQALGEVVATVGDGFNDLPAMAKTDVSIAFGKAIPITQARADVVVLSEELWAVPRLLALSHKTMTIIRQNLLWAALYNLTCVPLAVMGHFPAWAAGLGMAASSLWVVFHASQLAKDRSLITPGSIPKRYATQRPDSVHS
jgi:Cu2+-exporting ATPase